MDAGTALTAASPSRPRIARSALLPLDLPAPGVGGAVTLTAMGGREDEKPVKAFI